SLRVRRPQPVPRNAVSAARRPASSLPRSRGKGPSGLPHLGLQPGCPRDGLPIGHHRGWRQWSLQPGVAERDRRRSPSGRATARHPHPANLVCVNADQHFVVASHLTDGVCRDRRNIAVWFWELPEFPEEWHDRFVHYDEIWAASSFIANTLAPVAPIPVVRMPP